MTLSDLMAELHANGLQLVSCRVDGETVRSFTCTPAQVAPPTNVTAPAAQNDVMGDPSLERFVNRKEKRG